METCPASGCLCIVVYVVKGICCEDPSKSLHSNDQANLLVERDDGIC